MLLYWPNEQVNNGRLPSGKLMCPATLTRNMTSTTDTFEILTPLYFDAFLLVLSLITALAYLHLLSITVVWSILYRFCPLPSCQAKAPADYSFISSSPCWISVFTFFLSSPNSPRIMRQLDGFFCRAITAGQVEFRTKPLSLRIHFAVDKRPCLVGSELRNQEPSFSWLTTSSVSLCSFAVGCRLTIT